MLSSRRPDRRNPNYSTLTVRVGSCSPAGDYLIDYYDNDTSDWQTVSLAPNTQQTIYARGGARVTIRSNITSGASDQVWTVNGSQIPGRNQYCHFISVSGECGLTLTREEMSGAGVVVNNISGLSGSLAGKTASDFGLGD